ncbi:MAG: UDP-N-acetylmuramoyl-tripeptide--D-alanyl-D-alanine ligase [Ignavibacteriaceae bacterium]|nr:UDP-N-acetylmuramoyl-tripeptide--D-alanyl-D-alanine ligase [Ignavibacteriaceae bacterium]
MKKVHLNIEDIFNLTSSVIYEPDKLKRIDYVSIDSRKIKKNTLFIALKGKRLDGHKFIDDAIKNGAAVVMINHKNLNQFKSVQVPIISVKDSTYALGEVARIWRKKLNTKIIGITGSSGKTTVKEMIAELLSEKFSVNKTVSNNNNHIGVPLTILNTNDTHQILVAELGTNHFGEIPYTAKILSPDYSLITNIGVSHLEFLKSINGVWKEKSFLFEETIKNGGKVFLNYDDPIIKAKHYRQGEHLSYGFSGKTDVRANLKNYTDDGKPVIEINCKKKHFDITLPIYGEQSAKNFLAACTVALEMGLSIEEIKNAAKRLKAPAGRLDVQKYKKFILIDDTYNANPDSTKAAIELVGRIKTFKRKILFLGNMFELGSRSIKLHEGLIEQIRKSGINEVYTIGSLMKYLNKKLITTNIKSRHFSNRKLLVNFINGMSLDNSVVLVKGSRGMKMEEFVSVIKRKIMN